MNYLVRKLDENKIGFALYIIVAIILKITGVTILNCLIGITCVALGVVLFLPILGLIPALFLNGDYEGSDSSVSVLLWSVLLVIVGILLVL